MIQFGHNDKTATEAAYTANLRTLVAEVRARGADPVLVTPPVRRHFSGGRLTTTALHVNGVGADLPAAMRRVATETGTPLVDLTARSRALVEGLGGVRAALPSAGDGRGDRQHPLVDVRRRPDGPARAGRRAADPRRGVAAASAPALTRRP